MYQKGGTVVSREEKKKRIKHILLCCALLLAVYYILPIIGMAMDGRKGEMFLATGLIHLLFPLYLYISAIVLGLRHGFCSVYAVASAVLFFPTLLLYFSPQIWYAGLIYGGIALAGNLMGWGLKSVMRRFKEEQNS